MDSFAAIDFAEFGETPVELPSSAPSKDDDIMQRLVDSDRRLPDSYYGGACVIA
uniref:Pheromone n=1 Tax=Coprinopsis cinerea TaxID=5346 RepID=O74276_COPCI|nr:pheromone [Coprinopsis cinerea]